MNKINNNNEKTDIIQKYENEKKLHKITNDESYIMWLEKFSDKYSSFLNDLHLINIADLKKIDLENLNNLSILYQAIDSYVKSNKNHEIYEFYKIKYNNIGYIIGRIPNSDNKFYYRRVNINTGDDFIEFNDILFTKKNEKTDYINDKLNILTNIITSYYEDGIPLQSIKNCLSTAILELEEKDKNINKVKVKKG